MPIEIRELEINMTVSEDGNEPGAASAGAGASASNDVSAIVALCVDKVMEVLRDQKED